ncbi:MAG TPA: hypothetical protein VK501_01625 [Baekduia sp.]|uniref:hypothetical protein n=1 Tax=Baekduia sp. TaxID=2600305 RepID=UPI002C89D36C|nr:hypothetical protein [Baekduia sp.]HMJ32588.1 hypothetical protein [Baekduia sp.]
MFIRKPVLLAALAALGAIGVGANSASASVYAHGGNSTGNLLSTGNTLGTSTLSGNAVLTTSAGTVTCTTSAFSGTLTSANPATNLSGTLQNLSFGSPSTSACSDSIPFINVHDCAFYSDANNSASFSTNTTGTVLNTTVTVKCALSTGGNCYFRASAVPGTLSYSPASGTTTSNSLSYSSVAVSQAASPSSSFGCSSSGTFSATYTSIRATSGTYNGQLIAFNTTA